MAADNKDLRFRILTSVVGGDAINRFNGDITKTTRSASQMTSQLGTLTSGLKALAGAWVVKEAVTFVKELINTSDELAKVSQKTGVTVRDLTGFQAAAELSGISIESMVNGLKKLSINMVEASTGNREYAAAFKAAGIDIEDSNGKIRSSGDVVKEISDKFSKMEDGPEKAAIAFRIFGKAGTDMIPFLNAGAESLTKFGLAIDDDFARRSEVFNDTLTEMSIAAKNLLLSGVQELVPTLQEIANELKKTSVSSSVMKEGFKDVGEAFRLTAVAGNSLIASLYTLTDVIGTPLAMAASTLKDIWDGVAVTIYDTSRAAVEASQGNFSAAGDIFKDLMAKGKEGIRENFAEQNKMADDFLERLGRRGKAMNEFNSNLLKNSILFGNGTEGARKDTDPGPAPQRNLVADISKLAETRAVERDRVQEFIEQQKLENKLRRESLGDINLTALELVKLTEARKLDAVAIRQGKTMTEEQRAILMDATEEIKKQREQIVQMEFDMKRTFVFGARDYLRTYLDVVTNNALQIQQVMGTAFGALEDTMVSFVKTGKLNFKNFADSVISELIRIAVRQAVLAPIAGALSSAISGGVSGGGAEMGASTYSSAASSGAYTFADGGIMTSMGSVPLNKYANGGIANSPQVAIFGEGRTPEAYVPLPDGRSIPVSMKGSAGGDVNVSMTINLQGGKENSSVESDKQTGKAMGNLIKQAVLNTIVEQKRPGGLLAV